MIHRESYPKVLSICRPKCIMCRGIKTTDKASSQRKEVFQSPLSLQPQFIM